MKSETIDNMNTKKISKFLTTTALLSLVPFYNFAASAIESTQKSRVLLAKDEKIKNSQIDISTFKVAANEKLKLVLRQSRVAGDFPMTVFFDAKSEPYKYELGAEMFKLEPKPLSLETAFIAENLEFGFFLGLDHKMHYFNIDGFGIPNKPIYTAKYINEEYIVEKN